ncbi:hypothetical protein CFIMG_008058RA00001 [Ceratocystis fimbriata CBS 114723]|uniref:chitin deacetylase n=1 Tax=Ceratocystis fimbriata CBS 114723 TaxID=1035309 RepID=A0A2C5X882_9PEZI|nr:hypothetical protein CFIMG_008058RA00001 [Ceratocystis fimbriata CBS 114723]
MGILCLRLLRLPSRLRRRARRNRMSTLFILLTLCTLLVVPPYVIYKPPSLLIRHFAHRWPNVLFEVPTTKKLIALTIDDAPSPYTRDIAAILAANSAHATFFVIGGQVEDAGGTVPDARLRELVRAGHELGNHAMHDEPSRGLADDVLVDQVGQVHAKIKAVYGAEQQPLPPFNFFRPGSGFFSERMLKILGAINHRVVLGGIYPHDPQIPHAWINARHILSLARPGGIIICHDRRPWTLPMLETVLPELRKRGYEVVTVTRLLEEAKVS